jgi:hypothetical protein
MLSFASGSAIKRITAGVNAREVQMKVVLVAIAVLLPMGMMAQSTDPVWVPGSSQKVCQPNGEIDYETRQPTVSQTQTNYGLSGDDLGASFMHNGKLWLLRQ